MAKRTLPKHIDRIVKAWAKKQRRDVYVLTAEDLGIIGWALATTQEYLKMLEDDEYDHAQIMDKHWLVSKRTTRAVIIVDRLRS